MKVKSESEVAQYCPTLRDPMDCSLPGSSVHGIFQARVLEWVAIAFSRFILVFFGPNDFIDVYLISSVVLLSGTQQSDSVLHRYIVFFILFSIMVCHRVLI